MATTTTKPTTPADLFTTMTQGFTTAMKAGFDAQGQMMNHWTKAFGTTSPMFSAFGDVDAQIRGFTLAAAEIGRQSAGEVAELVTESAVATADIFGDAIETTFGDEAPTTLEEAQVATQQFTQNAMQVVRAATERTAHLAAKQVEAFQAIATQPGTTTKTTRRTSKTNK